MYQTLIDSTNKLPLPKPARRLFALAWPWLEALLVALLTTQFVATVVGVDGASMMPGLRHHERLLIPKYETWLHKVGVGQFRRGDIVVFKPPTGSLNLTVLGVPYRPWLVKRLVGLPGDQVRVAGGEVYVNGAALSQAFTSDYWQSQGCWDRESALANNARSDLNTRQPLSQSFTVPAHQYFVMGDNRSPGGSEDSRLFGPVPLRDVAGRAAAVIWPVVARTDAHYDCAARSRPQDQVRYGGAWRLNLRLLERPAALSARP
ncbi:signal peptidase I [Deinococcus sp.]|uniref:signal peptidase I n=1 Tax=Deinococcus sp. TaxID=47478 RepID=UPI0025EBABCB|nr:signal peptidase I [Deinococcus sp.]